MIDCMISPKVKPAFFIFDLGQLSDIFLFLWADKSVIDIVGGGHLIFFEKRIWYRNPRHHHQRSARHIFLGYFCSDEDAISQVSGGVVTRGL